MEEGLFDAGGNSMQVKKNTILVIFLILLFFFSNFSSASDSQLSINIDSKNSVNLGDYDNIVVTISETGGKKDAENVTVTFNIIYFAEKIESLDDIYIYHSSEYRVDKIHRNSYKQIVIPFHYPQNSIECNLDMQVITEHYEKELFGLKISGPYYSKSDKVVQLKDPYGYVDIISNPTNADVYMNGYYKGKTPLKIDRLKVDTYTFEIKKEGYVSVKEEIELKPAYTLNIQVSLPEAAREVHVSSTPANAEVYIDGIFKGTTPLNTKLPFGEYQIKLSKENHQTQTQTIVIDESCTSPFKIDFKLNEIVIPPKTEATPSVSPVPSSSSSAYSGPSGGETPVERHAEPVQSPGFHAVTVFVFLGLAGIVIRKRLLVFK